MALKPFNSIDGYSVGNTSIDVVYANGDVQAANLVVTNKSNLGSVANVIITGGSSGQYLGTDGTGNLSWSSIATATQIANGNSNITINANANINFAVRGVGNVIRLANTGFYSNAGNFILGNPIIQMGGNPNGAPLTSDDGKDRGIIMNYYDTFPAQAYFGWQNANNEFVAASEITVASDVITVYNLGNIRANWFYGNFNGNITGNLTVPGSNTQIVYNDNGLANSASGFTFNKTTQDVGISNNLSVTGTVSSGNFSTTGYLSVNGNANIGLNLTVIGEVRSFNQVHAANFYSDDFITALGDITGANFVASGDMTAVGNSSSNNMSVTSNLTVLGNVQVSGNSQFGGNSFRVTSNYANVTGNLTVGSAAIGVYLYPNGSATVRNLTVTPQAGSGGNFVTSNLSVTGTANFGSVNAVGNLSIASLTAANGNFAGNVLVGGYLSAAGNLTAANASLGNLVSANFLQGDGYLISNITVAAGSQIINGNSNVSVAPNANVTISVNGVSNIVNVTDTITYINNDLQANANVSVAGNINLGGIANGTTSITLTNTEINLNVNSNPVFEVFESWTDTNGNANIYGNATITDDLSVLGNAIITGQLSSTGNANVGNLDTNNIQAVTANFSGNVTVANLDGGNLVKANFFQGDGYLITNLTIAAGSAIVNGNSNVSVAPNADITFGANGIANVIVVNEIGTTIAANFNVNNNLSVTGNANFSTINGANINLSGGIIANSTINSKSTISAITLATYTDPIGGGGGGLSVANNATVGANLSVSGIFSAFGHSNLDTVLVKDTFTANRNAYFNYPSYFYNTVSVSNVATFSANANFTGNINATLISASGNITAGNINGGNLVSANFLSGDGYLISNLTVPAGTYLINGTSNLFVDGSGNVRTSVAGAPNVLVVTSTGANITGTLSVSGNANVGNIGGGAGLFTGNVTGANANFTGNFVSGGSNANFAGNINVTTNATILGNITSGNANLGNYVYANFLEGDGYLLTNLTIPAGTAIVNGNSNVLVEYSGNVNFKSNGVANIVVVTSGGLISNGYVNAASFANGNSNISIAANGNISFGVIGTSNVFVVSNLGANLTGAFYNTGNTVITGNANIGNIGTTGVVTAAGNITGGNLVATGRISAVGNANLGNIGTGGILTVVGNSNIGNIGTTNIVATGGASFGANVDMGSTNNIINLAEPVNPQDAATKYYVDSVAQGLNVHPSCNVATPNTLANISGGTVSYNNGSSGVGANLVTTGTFTTIDGVNIATVGTRILVKNESNAVWNGIYTYSNSTVLVRATDFDTTAEAAGGDFTFVTSGSTYADTGWVQTTDNVVMGVDPVVWQQFSGAGTYQAGTGLTLTGQVFNVNNSQPQITSVGTLTGLSVSGNINSGNLIGGNLVSANYLQGTLITGAQPNITSTGTLTSISVSGNANIGNIGTAGLITATGNITGGNLITSGILTVSGNANIGNIGTAGIITATGNITGGNLSTAGQISATGNITANYIIGNGSQLTNVTASGGNANFANFAGNVTVSSQPNITSTGTLVSLSVSGNANIGNIGTAGLITATGNITGANLITGGLISAAGNITGANLSITGNATVGNLITGAGSGGNISGANNISANTFTGALANGNSNVNIPAANGNVTISSAGNANIVIITGTGVNVAGTVSISGNLNVGNIIGPFANGNSNVSIPSANGNVNISSAGNANILIITGTGANINGTLSVSGNANVGNIGATLFVGNISGTGNSNVGNLGFGSGVITGTGNITAGNLIGPHANGNSNVNIPSANGNVTISSAGNANIVIVTGTGANINGTISVSGNANIGNIGTAGLITATGNITGANLVTGGVLSVTGNANVGNIGATLFVGNISGTGNSNVGNLGFGSGIITGTGTISTTGNANVGNLNVSARSNLGAVGNVIITGGTSGYVLQTDGAGNLSWVAQSGGGGGGASISNGTSNVNIPTSSGNITAGVSGNANIIIITGTGANINGYANVSGNFSVGNKSNLGAAGNVIITGGTSGYVLQTDGAGNLSWAAQTGGNTTAVYVDNFTGNGVQTAFTLSVNPLSKNNMFVNIDGVDQLRSAYSISGTTLTFTGAPSNGSSVEVTTILGAATAYANLTTRTYTGDGSTANYAVSNGVSAGSLLVALNGVLQTPTTDYTVSGTTLTFTTAPASSEAIQIRELTSAVATGMGPATVTSDTFTGNGVQTTFTLSTVPVNKYWTLVNYQSTILPHGDYSVTGNSLVLSSPAANGAAIEVITYGQLGGLSSIYNGTSNVNIPSANGNVSISSNGNANIFIVTGTGANVTGTFDATGNVSSNGKPLATTGKAIAMSMVFGG